MLQVIDLEIIILVLLLYIIITIGQVQEMVIYGDESEIQQHLIEVEQI
jgi:hypothetical protein